MPPNRRHTLAAAWVALAAALLVALSGPLTRVLHAPGDHVETVGLCAALLAFAASAFGLRTWERVAQIRAGKEPT